MIDAIATSVNGLQTASRHAQSAAEVIANPQTYAGAGDSVDISAKAAEGLSSGSLESAVVALKTAAIMYKANAQALDAIFRTQQEAFDRLV